MKRTIIIMIVFTLCLFLCACADKTQSTESDEEISSATETMPLNTDNAPYETISDEDSKESTQSEKGGTAAVESVVDETETTDDVSDSNTKGSAVTTTTDHSSATKENTSTTSTNSSEETTSSVTQKAEITIPAESSESENDTVTEEIVIVRPSAAEVSEKVVQYINQFRIEQGAGQAAVLSGLTQIAEYRSMQLVTNFAHDTLDERAALAYYQYGKYVDMTKYGFDESYNYYTYGGGEAIAKGNWGGTADEIALKIATGFKNSSGHWAYVGSSEYNYIAVGCTYDPSSCSWYCCVLVSIENYG